MMIMMIIILILMVSMSTVMIESSKVVEVNLTVSLFQFEKSPISFVTRGYNVDDDGIPTVRILLDFFTHSNLFNLK